MTDKKGNPFLSEGKYFGEQPVTPDTSMSNPNSVGTFSEGKHFPETPKGNGQQPKPAARTHG